MLKLLNAEEHLSCPNYDSGQYPSIEEVRVASGEIRQVNPRANKLVFVLQGQAEYSTGRVLRYPVRQGHAFFLPGGWSLCYRSLEDSRLLIIRLYDKIRFCDCLSVEDLHRINEKRKNGGRKPVPVVEELAAAACHPLAEKEEPFHLKVNEVTEKYLEMLTLCHGAGLRCRYYHEEKIRELMYIFRAFYPKEDLCRFFAPVLAADAGFAAMLMNCYYRYGNLAQIASAMNYTVSGFEKKFRKVFGCSPYNWMVRQKAREIWHCIHTSDMNLKQIADSFGFSSASSFNNFFKQHFGITPGQARRNILKRRD